MWSLLRHAHHDVSYGWPVQECGMQLRARGAHARALLFVMATTAFVMLGPGVANAESPTSPRKLRVGTYEDPPFSMKDPETGRWTGLAVELWHEVADRMGVEYELKGYDSPEHIFDLLNSGALDIEAAAVPISLEQVDRLEFSSAFVSKGYSIATLPRQDSSWVDALGGPLTSRLRDMLLATVAVLVGGAVAIWWMERRRNPDHFGGSVSSGKSCARPAIRETSGTANSNAVTNADTGLPGKPSTRVPSSRPASSGLPGRSAIFQKSISAPNSRSTGTTRS